MRQLADFSLKEWLRLLPLSHGFKQVRNDLFLGLYKCLRPKGFSRFLHETRGLQGKNVVIVVAFEQPWALDWLLRSAARNLTDASVIVCDNSRRESARREIEDVCRQRGVPYLALPKNPTRHPNRSHGMAMTWIYYNVVRAIEPRVFAFIDHDLIPVQKVSISERMAGQPFFGMPLDSIHPWSLWAGYCLFDFRAVAGLPLNFLYDFSLGLDTGGRNWNILYKNHDRQRISFADCGLVRVTSPVGGDSASVQFVDHCWFHIGGIGYGDHFQRKVAFCKQISSALDDGIPWSDMVS